MTKIARHYYFVYRQLEGCALDIRCPCGGVTVRTREDLAEQLAHRKAVRLYPNRPWEHIKVAECRDALQRRQARLLELDKKRADSRFRELMGV